MAEPESFPFTASPVPSGKTILPFMDSSHFYEPDEDDGGREMAQMTKKVEGLNRPTLNGPSRSDSLPIIKSADSEQMRTPARTSSPANGLRSNHEKKMHQTSTRIMRTNPDGRPFASDFHDLFSTLMVSLDLRTHRSRFKSYPFSFTTEEAVLNLANLKFAQSNRMPDPNDSSRVVTTTTTTTFSMARDMAKALCQRFMDARFFESGTDKSQDTFKDKTIWTLTPKGICKLGRFIMRNGINADHVNKLLSSNLNTMQLIVLERDSETDEILQDKSIVEIVFRRFLGKVPNVKSSITISDSDTISEYLDGLVGVKLAETRRYEDQTLRQSFTGRTAMHWITDCTTVLDPDEAREVAEMFVSQNLISYVGDGKGKPANTDSTFQTLKSSIYVITAKGRRIAGWESNQSGEGNARTGTNGRPGVKTMVSEGGSDLSRPLSPPSNGKDCAVLTGEVNGAAKETNSHRLHLILADAALRSQFREFLRENYCEENFSFYQDVIDFVRQINSVQTIDGVSEGLAKAYSIYNAYLAAGSPCELNLDHQLRLEMAAQMTKAVDGDETSMYQGLAKVAELFDRAQKQVFRLMAGDSVPKFLKTPLYLELMEDHSSDGE
ncbi:Developmental regulator FlbA [Taphrina deformans PYCC 5710]|uniref:Developmental regulator FlbA n=1 Tax=Taphrina deformans (strain PYCC 5710 / ATCC 11124 / CBS 356.35 / IMI 108563 / JCM 9778 / NBRC 8474) TaxID=1097556 RepID=R4XC85_TAPDE|nr:Developmental regulator FlbA [Taphrina deformans PYCC 5710]|eukprot:CCG83180.1 Developmental regulator FlbA [Taphrina deformans PYCC 5710]